MTRNLLLSPPRRDAQRAERVLILILFDICNIELLTKVLRNPFLEGLQIRNNDAIKKENPANAGLTK